MILAFPRIRVSARKGLVSAYRLRIIAQVLRFHLLQCHCEKGFRHFRQLFSAFPCGAVQLFNGRTPQLERNRRKRSIVCHFSKNLIVCGFSQVVFRPVLRLLVGQGEDSLPVAPSVGCHALGIAGPRPPLPMKTKNPIGMVSPIITGKYLCGKGKPLAGWYSAP